MTLWSLGFRMGFVLAGMKTTWILLYISIRALEWSDVPSMSTNILKGSLFFWAVALNNGFKTFSILCCKQMSCHPGFVIPFIEHSRFSIILRGPMTFRMIKISNGFSLKSPAALAPNQRVSLSFEAWFFSLAVKVPDGIFFQDNAVSSALKICC